MQSVVRASGGLLGQGRASAQLAIDCFAGQAALFAWADAALARWPGPGPDFIPWACRRAPAAGGSVKGHWSVD
eukprot:12646983-Alexandrium_andersonii.AAC.1